MELDPVFVTFLITVTKCMAKAALARETLFWLQCEEAIGCDGGEGIAARAKLLITLPLKSGREEEGGIVAPPSLSRIQSGTPIHGMVPSMSKLDFPSQLNFSGNALKRRTQRSIF